MAGLTIGVAAGELLAPTVVAIVLALVLAPVANRLERLGLHSGAAALLTAVVAIGIIVAGPSRHSRRYGTRLTGWVKRAPQIVHSVEHKLAPLKKQLAAFQAASQQISRVPGAAPASKVVVAAPASSVDGAVITSVALTAPSVLAMILYVTVVTIFLLSERKRYIQQLILLPRTLNGRLRMARICRDVRHRVSGYLFTLTMINIGLAVTTSICFTIAGIPEPIVWGVAYGVRNVQPIIGPTTIILSSALVGFATADTIAGALLPPAILIVIDTIEAYFVQPWLLGRRTGRQPHRDLCDDRHAGLDVGRTRRHHRGADPDLRAHGDAASAASEAVRDASGDRKAASPRARGRPADGRAVRLQGRIETEGRLARFLVDACSGGSHGHPCSSGGRRQCRAAFLLPRKTRGKARSLGASSRC